MLQKPLTSSSFYLFDIFYIFSRIQVNSEYFSLLIVITCVSCNFSCILPVILLEVPFDFFEDISTTYCLLHTKDFIDCKLAIQTELGTQNIVKQCLFFFFLVYINDSFKICNGIIP